MKTTEARGSRPVVYNAETATETVHHHVLEALARSFQFKKNKSTTAILGLSLLCCHQLEGPTVSTAVGTAA